MSFTRRPGSGRPRQTSRREDRHVERNARVQPTASLTSRHSSDDNRFRVWRPCCECLNLAFALQRHTAATELVFQQDNARPHMARVSQDCLRTVTPLPWPARSPDLSPIEHVWDHPGWRVGNPASLNELEARLQQIWNEMSQDIIQNLCASMPDRIASCVRARVGKQVWLWCLNYDKGRTYVRDEKRAFSVGCIRPSYSPDLSPSDFHLFEPLKNHLRRQHFRIDAEVQQAVLKWLYNLHIDFYNAVFDGVVYQWNKCLDKCGDGDYAEK
ncbi:transposable element Tcb1 transposase [Trichonephila clavipes]|nr:transposable element Tcb1 transposase [Trichonephila clavipes]